ncbi:hypothetical protein VMCG_08974 [Cytospora schulzeri]|uniref:NACHT-NTPase and P-loop NTPases N-terminal domain-containing protein n=1 Tax=Cytospora schulzeri TaxID=448051 RepID=A0A423VPM9_9PEZI|nr:hypothetical protein VMCG_08974 [Valsa malicola]
MDTYLLKAAVHYALSANQHTATLVDDFVQNASFTNEGLDPLMYELFDLRTPLARLGDSDLVIPTRLHPPILAVVRGCGDALARVDAILCECADDSMQDASWAVKGPEVRELMNGLQTSRRALQLATEVVSLAAAKDVGADAETFTTYLDQDTSRVLALIRRTLQQVQESENKEPLNLTLRQSLDDIRLYVQSLCRFPTREEVRPKSPSATTAEPLVDEYNEDASTVATSVLNPKPASPEVEAPKLRLGSGLRPAKRLTNAFTRWSLTSTRKPHAASTLTPTVSPFSQPLSGLSSPKMQADDDEFSIASSAPQASTTSRQASHTSHRSQNSLRSSTSSQVSRVVSASSVPLGLFPPMLPLRNPRRSTLTSMDESVALIPSPPTPLDSNFSTPPAIFDQASIAGSAVSYSSEKHGSGGTISLPFFAVSPPDKIYIDPSDVHVPFHHQQREIPAAIGLVRTKLLPFNEKGSGNAVTVFHIDTSPASYILASKHGDKTIKIHGLPQSNLQSTMKINFYVNMQPRSRDFFVASHSILSETSALVAVASGFGHNLEIWNWARKKRLQSIESAYRWASAPIDIYETAFPPLACYRDTADAIDLYPVIKDSSSTDTKGSNKKPFAPGTGILIIRSTSGRSCWASTTPARSSSSRTLSYVDGVGAEHEPSKTELKALSVLHA